MTYWVRVARIPMTTARGCKRPMVLRSGPTAEPRSSSWWQVEQADPEALFRANSSFPRFACSGGSAANAAREEIKASVRYRMFATSFRIQHTPVCREMGRITSIKGLPTKLNVPVLNTNLAESDLRNSSYKSGPVKIDSRPQYFALAMLLAETSTLPVQER